MSSVVRQMVVVALLLATVVGLFVAAQVGQRRLEDASARLELGARRQQALAALTQLVREAESSQRGYILIGNATYLEPLQRASAALGVTLQRLDAAFSRAGSVTRGNIEELKRLSNSKFEEMHHTIELFTARGRTAALEFIRSDQGATTMAEIDGVADRIVELESAEALDASRSWQVSRWASFATSSVALAASAGLLLLLTRLTLRQWRFRELQTEQLTERQGELEKLVEKRTEELSELSTHLQTVAEQEKAALSRELHDELGGLLVAARMDLSWLEERLGSNDPEVREYFGRVQQALQAGVDIKRRVIENLRPTLLDNLGLVPALNWQVSETCERAGLRHIERYPQQELTLTAQAAIAVFRIVQEALANVLKHARAGTVEASLEIAPPWLLVRVQDDGVGIPPRRLRALQAHGLAAMRHRARALGGQLEIQTPRAGGTRIEVRLPLERVLLEGSTAHLEFVRERRA